MNFLKVVEKIVAKLKHDPSYKIKIELSNRELLAIIIIRGMQIFRGFFKRIRLKKASGMLFFGRRVILEHAYMIETGPGLIVEDFVHINALSEKGIQLGANVTIAKYSSLVCSGVIANKGIGIKIGNSSAVGAQSFIGGQGGVEIGNDVIMGPGVRIFSENHNYSHPEIPIRKQGESRKGVKIGDNCWIGAGSTILDGVNIGHGCVIAAGSVVNKDIEANSIAAGIPAKVLKSRVEK
ncbi:MAG: transferase [Candidatus Brocadia sp. WS118]|nr:MAG: transferase [Candidatus Brocadia sp. WS118]